MGVSEAESEKVLRGSREGFSDSVKTNSALVRKRLRDTRMKVEEYQMGVRSNTVLQILYIDDLVHEELLEQIKERIEEYEIDGVLDSGMLEQLTEESWYSPFFFSTVSGYGATGPCSAGAFERKGCAAL